MVAPILVSALPDAAPELAGHIIHNTVAGVTSKCHVAEALDLIPVASAADVNTGTEAIKAITPDAFAASNFGIRLIEIKVVSDTTGLVVGNGKVTICIPAEMTGMNLVSAEAFVTTAATGGTIISIMIRNVTDTVDMLDTAITIDAAEFTSYTADARSAVDVSEADVVTGDRIAIDIDAVGSTLTGQGLGVILGFQLP